MQVKASVWTQRERPAAAWVQGRTVLALGVLLGWAVQSARLGPESTAVKPAARPGQAHLPTRGQRPADARLGRCWTSVVSSQRPGVARVPGGGGGVLVGRSGSRGQKPAWLESAERPERPGARGGVYAHGTRTRPHPAAPGARPQETVLIHTIGSEASTARSCNVRVFLLFPNCLCESPPGGMAALAVCSNWKEAGVDRRTQRGSRSKHRPRPRPQGPALTEHGEGVRPGGVVGAGGACLPGTGSGCCSSSVPYLHLETEAREHSCPAEGRRDVFANQGTYILQRSLFTG